MGFSFTVGSKYSTQCVIGGGNPLVFIGGPCAIESRDHALSMAESIAHICSRVDIPFIFKSCYNKDSRSSLESFHGVGIDEGLAILSEIKETLSIPVVSDFSDPAWAQATGEVCDLIQIPAYLCRQTSILRAAAETKKPVHLKKGQFMSPWNMKNSVEKLRAMGCEEMLLTDRGTFFGYDMLVNDFRGLQVMAETGYPVCLDATHSVQLPTSDGKISKGQREFIPGLVRAACAFGVDALFLEVHSDPENALSDKNTVLPLDNLENILIQAKQLHQYSLEIRNKNPVELLK